MVRRVIAELHRDDGLRGRHRGVVRAGEPRRRVRVRRPGHGTGPRVLPRGGHRGGRALRRGRALGREGGGRHRQ